MKTLLTLLFVLAAISANAADAKPVRVTFTLLQKDWIFDVLPDGSVFAQFGSSAGDSIQLPAKTVNFAEFVQVVRSSSPTAENGPLYAAVCLEGETASYPKTLEDDTFFRKFLLKHKKDWQGWDGRKPSRRMQELMQRIVYYRTEPAWQRFDAGPFSFSGPPDFSKTAAQGFDSYVSEFKRRGLVLCFDYGAYSNNFNGWPDSTRYESATVDGRPARIGTAPEGFTAEGRYPLPYSVQIAFRGVEPGIHLSMSASCETPEDCEIAKRIFQSIRFKQSD